MNNETEKNDNRTEPLANSLAKRVWQSPEIEEVDFAETKASGVYHGSGDLDGYS
jgi:hypothetical protein